MGVEKKIETGKDRSHEAEQTREKEHQKSNILSKEETEEN